MKSKDLVKQEYRTQLTEALQSKNPDDFTEAMANIAMSIQQSVMSDLSAYQVTNDESILAARGVRHLTSQETKFYECAMKAIEIGDVRQAFGDLSPAYPQSIIDRVLEDIKSEFPLLSVIDVQNTKTLTRVIVNKKGVQYAAWGAIGSKITKELDGAIGYLDLGINKLTAYMLVSKDMLYVGPEWVDAYVRAVLVEAIGAALCKAVIAGTGKDEPIGMMKDVSDDVTVTAGVYPDKTAVAITDLSPTTIGAIAKTIAQGPNGRKRAVPELLMVVNSVDYFEKVFPATTFLTPSGGYVKDVLPYPTKIVQDENVPSGKAIFGLAKKYKLGVGVGATGGKIEFSDEFRYLDDERVYVTRMYGNGRAMDNNAFVLVDISELEAANYTIKVVKEETTVSGSDSDGGTT